MHQILTNKHTIRTFFAHFKLFRTTAAYKKRSCVKMNIVADVPLKCRANERNQVYLIAECSRHYEKSNLLYEGQRPVWR